MIWLGGNQLGEGYKVIEKMFINPSQRYRRQLRRYLIEGLPFLLLLIAYYSQSYTELLARPEEDRYARFIALLEKILPQEFHDEWLGDLQEQHYQLIEEGIPRWKVSLITLLTGLGLIRSYLWLKFHKLVSRWITRANKVFWG